MAQSAKFEDDIAVKKETILKLFDPPPGKTQFHAWVNKGKIKKARDLGGYFLLNATRVHQGMPPVDIKAYRLNLKKRTRAYRKKQLLYAAFIDLDSALEFAFDDIELPETLETREVDFVCKASRSICKHFEVLGIRDRYEKTIFCKGLLEENVELELIDDDFAPPETS